MRTIPHVIGGRRQEGDSGRTAPVFNPASGQQIAVVNLAGPAEVDAAIAAAAAAFPSWRDTSIAKRTEILFAVRHTLHEHRDELAALITAEHGKVLSDAAGEVARGIENIEFACGIGQLLKGGYSAGVTTGISVHELHQPLGVVAGITPFNFPVMVPLWMIGNAIACGNTFVLKPSEKDPSASGLLAELLGDAGLPDGVFNVVHGDKDAVNQLIDHPDVAGISFVGSTPVAREVYQRATALGKRAQSLGGAKNHMVVLPDADVDMAADAVVSAAYGSAGERCMAVSVVVTVGEIAEPIIAAVKERIDAVRVGPGTEPASQMGPLVTAAHRDRVAGYVATAATAGATIIADGRRLPAAADATGFYLGPTLIDNVTTDMSVYQDEVFGPVLSVVRADTFEQALAVVNESPYGNGAAIFTRDGGAAARFETEVSAGMVGVNVPIPVPVAYYSFGGWKASLFGDAHMYGPEGVRFYTRTKVVTTRWPDPASSRIDLGFPVNR